MLAATKPEDFLRLGKKYLADTRIYRTDKPYFIDKMPNNFRHIGLIHLMLPNARIIDARRAPVAYRAVLPDESRTDAALG